MQKKKEKESIANNKRVKKHHKFKGFLKLEIFLPPLKKEYFDFLISLKPYN